MHAGDVLRASPLFASLGEATLVALAEHCVGCFLRGGQLLFEVGDASDDLYVVASGRLLARRVDGHILGEIGPGEPIGEIGAINGEPRGATVQALRDSVLLRIPQASLDQLFIRQPQVLRRVSEVVISRLTQNQREREREQIRNLRTLTLLPAQRGAATRALAEGLQQALSPYGSTRLIDAAAVDAALGKDSAQTPFDATDNERVLAWLNEIESTTRYLIYVAGEAADPWARRCIRQADRLLLLADAQTPPTSTPMLALLRELNIRVPLTLVLSGGKAATSRAAGWRAAVGSDQHLWCEVDDPVAVARLARRVTGRGVGLVLGGGGARGFAHVGLLQALDELGIDVDLIGGASMGAFIGALAATGLDPTQIRDVLHASFVRRNHLNDYLWPRVSLIRGRKFLKCLRGLFGETRIEDLPRSLYVVSTNLTTGHCRVHEDGEMALWVATSMCVPGVAPPVVQDGQLYADGAVVNSLPTDIMRHYGPGTVYASDVSTAGDLRADGIEGPAPEGLLGYRGPSPPPRLLDILFRTATLTSESGVQRRTELADHYLRMPVEDVRLFDWPRLDELIERGRRHALETLGPAGDRLAD